MNSLIQLKIIRPPLVWVAGWKLAIAWFGIALVMVVYPAASQPIDFSNCPNCKQEDITLHTETVNFSREYAAAILLGLIRTDSSGHTSSAGAAM